MPRFAIAVAVIALFAAVLAPTAGATSPSQDQYGSALPGVGGGGNSSGSPSSSSSSSGTGESTIPVAPSSSSTTPTTSSDTSSAATGSGGNGGGSAHSGSKASQKTNNAKANSPSGSNNGTATPARNANQSVPHIAADSAGDSWVPWFIGGLVTLGAAGAVLVIRNRRRATQS